MTEQVRKTLWVLIDESPNFNLIDFAIDVRLLTQKMPVTHVKAFEECSTRISFILEQYPILARESVKNPGVFCRLLNE